MALSAKQQAFVEHYLQCWNASEAARRAGYSEKTAGAIGHENLKKPEIEAAINERVKELKMDTDEILVGLAEHARGTMEDFLNPTLETLDLARAERAGKLHLVRKFSHTVSEKSEHIAIELYDAQAALVQLGRAHSLFTDNVDVKSGGKALKAYVSISPDDWDDDGDGDTDEGAPTASTSDPAG